MKKYQAFTIVELIIVIVVISILTLVIMVGSNRARLKSHNASVEADVSQMDKAQKVYISETSLSGIAVDPSGTPLDVLFFQPSTDNKIYVKLAANGYCVFGINPKSKYKDLQTAYVKKYKTADCEAMRQELINPPPIKPKSDTYLTVAEIGRRLENFRNATGAYPRVSEIENIGLIISPSNAGATQHQLYCRNDSKALYLQVDKQKSIVYAWDTSNKFVSEPQILSKLSLVNVCPEFGIPENSPGYESTGIKTPRL